jgi:Histone-like transcription factor (CBF/NF-Y) and archaeal histone
MTKDGFQRRQREKQKRLIEEEGVLFPVKRTRRLLQKYSASEKVTFEAGLRMAVTLHYMASRLCTAAVNCCSLLERRRTILPKHIRKGIKDDDGLCRIMETLSLRDRTPRATLAVDCDQVSANSCFCVFLSLLFSVPWEIHRYSI